MDSQLYEFAYGRPAIITEIYLPAKYAMSPDFLNALDDSLQAAKVKQHFTSETNTDRIFDCLPEKLKDKYDVLKPGLLAAGRCFGGYSIYDLKGAWRNDPTPASVLPEIERDANLCVRLVDWPNPLHLFPADEALSGTVVRTVFALRLHHLAPPPVRAMFPGREADVSVICEAIDTWIDQASLLLYGFVMCHVIAATRGRETVILLTSHFTIVNQYGRKKEEKALGEQKTLATRTECCPANYELTLGSVKEVIVIGENAPPDQVWAAYGHDSKVVSVAPAGTPHGNGVAKFILTPVAVGATTVTFGIGESRTCVCKVLVR